MEGLTVASNIYQAMTKHPKFLLPIAIYLIVAILITFALLVPPILSLHASMNSTSASQPPSPAAMALIKAAVIQLIPAFIALIIISALLGVIIQAMYSDMVSKWENKDISLMESFNVAVSRFVSLLLYTIILAIIETVLILILFSPTIFALIHLGASGVTPGHGALLGLVAGLAISLLLSLLVAIIIVPLLFTGAPIVVIEKSGPISAFKSSIALGKKDFFGILGVIVVAVIAYIIFYVVVVVISLLTSFLPFIGAIITIILSAFFTVFVYCLAPMYYVTFGQSKLNGKAASQAAASQPSAKPRRKASKK